MENVHHEVVVNYVGYLYNPHIHDCVFILPKVIVDKHGMAFSHLDPSTIIHVEEAEGLADDERRFLYEFAVWIYRALFVFNKYNPENDIVYHKQMLKVGSRQKHLTNTYLEVLLALIDFNKKNRNFFMTILKNLHSGLNKINWTRTIARCQAIVQNNRPVYLNPVNKKRQINFDEELLIIFFSILKHINEKYGFPVTINVGFELITGAKFEHYLNGYGQVRLRQIKYKYFSDKALYLWELCFAFFDKARNISVASELQEYLIAKNFNIVFESIIDELVGDKKAELPDGLKDQNDGKRVDHLYSYKGLTTVGTDDKSIYYIGDSKYYHLKNDISDESVYKQYTYARNVIQWNMDIFLNPDEKNEKWRNRTQKYRDDVTEGYNIVPNFFISARMDEGLSYADRIYNVDKEKQSFVQRHFENRLFDRDTLLIYHYDVNFLYVVSLYAQDNDSAKRLWKDKVRKMFREEIQKMLEASFSFYAMTAHPGVDAKEYIEKNFQSVLGKMYKPYQNPDYFSLALDNGDKYKAENEELLVELRKHFYVEEIKIGIDPEPKLVNAIEAGKAYEAEHTNEEWLTEYHVERYQDEFFVVGMYHDKAHLDWIKGNNKDKTLRYNVRLAKNREGAQQVGKIHKMRPKFAILYEEGHEFENKYHVFRINGYPVMSEEDMKTSFYPREPKGDYLIFSLEEEVKIGHYDINKLISTRRIDTKEQFIEGAPIYVKGNELLEYKR